MKALLTCRLLRVTRIVNGGVHPVPGAELEWKRLAVFAEEFTPAVRPLLDHYTGERPLFDLHGVEDEIQKALARRVDLKSGGYLIIDQTEAMTTVDVNTGGFVGQRNFDDTIFKTNLEAAQAIARQLRLRNLGGIIIIDFIDMESEDHRAAVLGELERPGPFERGRRQCLLGVEVGERDFAEGGIVDVGDRGRQHDHAGVCQAYAKTPPHATHLSENRQNGKNAAMVATVTLNQRGLSSAFSRPMTESCRDYSGIAR